MNINEINTISHNDWSWSLTQSIDESDESTPLLDVGIDLNMTRLGFACYQGYQCGRELEYKMLQFVILKAKLEPLLSVTSEQCYFMHSGPWES